VTRTINSQRFPPQLVVMLETQLFSSWRGNCVFWLTRIVAKSARYLPSRSPVSVCPRDSTRLWADGFPSNLILGDLCESPSRILPNLVKIWKKKLGHFTWSLTYIYFASELKFAIKHCCAAPSIFVLLTVTCNSALHIAYCCLCIATVITLRPHNFTLEIARCIWCGLGDMQACRR
jgi:hypothetical protein